jgi:hypothetical protein
MIMLTLFNKFFQKFASIVVSTLALCRVSLLLEAVEDEELLSSELEKDT